MSQAPTNIRWLIPALLKLMGGAGLDSKIAAGERRVRMASPEGRAAAAECLRAQLATARTAAKRAKLMARIAKAEAAK